MTEHPSLQKTILIRGGGDLASGVALILKRAGYQIVMAELAAPLVVRRKVSFAQAVLDRTCKVEEVTGELAASPEEAIRIMNAGNVAVLIDPNTETLPFFRLSGLVDGRMIKSTSDQRMDAAPCVIGLGPGFYRGGKLPRRRRDKARQQFGPGLLAGPGRTQQRNS